MRNTIADGINFCVGMNQSTIENCAARGTGDDCFAIWPAVFASQQFPPGFNLITHCTAQLPFLANGSAIYGRENNKIKNCSFEDCDIKTSGGFDHEWDWRAAVEICIDKRNISGIEISNINIGNSLSNGFSVIAKNEVGKMGALSNATLQKLNISNYGLGAKGKHGLFISSDAHGSLVIKKSNIPEIKNESGDFNIAQ
jgi:hypothetical protein